VQNQLTHLVKYDKKNWVEFYILLEEVEENQLWKEAGTANITQWIHEFAEKAKVHVSLI